MRLVSHSLATKVDMHYILINAALSGTAGFITTAAFTTLSGANEPWKPYGHFFEVFLFCIGLGLGVARPKGFWAHYVGLFLGQSLYALLFLRMGPLALLGFIWLAWLSLAAFTGAAVGAGVRKISAR